MAAKVSWLEGPSFPSSLSQLSQAVHVQPPLLLNVGFTTSASAHMCTGPPLSLQQQQQPPSQLSSPPSSLPTSLPLSPLPCQRSDPLGGGRWKQKREKVIMCEGDGRSCGWEQLLGKCRHWNVILGKEHGRVEVHAMGWVAVTAFGKPWKGEEKELG